MRFVPPIVEVTWTDACDEQGTWDLDDIMVGKGPGLCHGRRTTGRLCFVNEHHLELFHDYDEDTGEVGNATVIPIGWIDKVVHMKRGTIYTREVPTRRVKPSNS